MPVANHISDLVPDPENRRRHNPRNIGMVVDALHKVGAARSIVIDENNVILAGNGVTEAAGEAGITKVRVVEASGDEIIAVRRVGLTAEQKRSLAIADNRAAELAEWDPEQLAADAAAGLELEPWFSDRELEGIIGKPALKGGYSDPEAIPDQRRTSIKAGDVLELGRHTLICGDTTAPEVVRRVAGARALTLLHADPPYGMGKEAEGIANDNLYEAKLDAFQMLWWQAWAPLCAENASAYIWGQAADLWRLWWLGGLKDAPGGLVLRNEIVWDKGSGFGMRSSGHHSYPTATERCLFLMLGQQFLGNQNKDDYFEGYEPLRAWLEQQRDAAGWKNSDVNRITKTNMAGHWMSKSQFTPMPRHHYETLQQAAEGRAFVERYDDLFGRIFGGVKTDGNAHRRELSQQLRESRSFFDNTHEAMTDVWNFPRVAGEERYGHATPKPVAMVVRAFTSSTQGDDVIGVPFGGTAPEVIAAEQLDRRVVIAELEPGYCQIIVDRWEAFTQAKAKKVAEAMAG